MTCLLLEPGVAVIPVGAVLSDREAIGECFSRFDAREAHARHPIHAGRQQQSVLMNRRVFIETIRDAQ